VPFIARQPGRIPSGVVSDAIAMNIDLLPTICAWTGTPLPAAELDGKDIRPLLTSRRAPSPHDHLVLFNNEQVVAIRTQEWKLSLTSYYRTIEVPLSRLNSNHLTNMRLDPEEAFDLASRHPEVMAAMMARAEAAKAKFDPFAVRRAAPVSPAN
jgi:uncharacterized sulfatase